MAKTELSTITLETDQNLTKIYQTHCLIGKILLHKPLDQTLVKSFTQTEWKCKTPPTVSYIKRNMFLFNFRDKDDLVHVLKNRPWTIMGGLLVLSVCTPGEIANEMNFTYSTFWVQAHGLPLNYLTPKNGSKIGSFLGIFVCADWEICHENVSWRRFHRVKVILDVTMPLKTGFWLRRPGFHDVWVDFKYENLGVFCYKCGRIGNSFRTCKFPVGPGKYGPWIRADVRDRPISVKTMDIESDEDDCTTILAVPRAEVTLIKSSNVDICESMEFEETPHEDENVPTRCDRNRLICNCVDSTIMSINCAIIFSRVKFVDESEGSWRLLILMAAHLFHLTRKFARVYQRSGFEGKDGNGPNGNALSEILISIMFLVILVLF